MTTSRVNFAPAREYADANRCFCIEEEKGKGRRTFISLTDRCGERRAVLWHGRISTAYRVGRLDAPFAGSEN
jgi:hypothetical protein